MDTGMHLDAGKEKQKTAILSGIVNAGLVLLKLIVGILSGSISILSEAAHSGVDLLASGIAYYAVRTASKPSDNKHAYGHGKIENVSGAVEAFLVVLAAVWIVYEAVEKFTTHSVPEYLDYGIVVMLISTIANWWITRRLFKVAKETESHALEADALHHQADVWTSVGILVGLALIKLTGLYWLDPLIALFMAAVIFKAGWDMTKDNLSLLLDTRLPLDEECSIKNIIACHADVISISALRTRRSGSVRLIEVCLVFNKDLHLEIVHKKCDEIEAAIIAQLGQCDIVIHPEPAI